MSDETDADVLVDRQVKRLSRRAFFTGGVAAAVGFGAYKWLRSRPAEDGLAWPFRRVLHANESLARAYFSPSRLTPTFRERDITRLRINGRIGLTKDYDVSTWRLNIAGAAAPATLTIDDIRALPVHEMIAELRCIEGWSIIVKWKGARLRDLIERFPPATATRYLGLETPGRGYYVGLDMESALHPQTLLVYEMNDAPLTLEHGAPLRLAIPVKYGIKNIKRIATLRYSDDRPADFWGERGYDWYAGF
ncbi:MAG TPA: molybdopterin-dependent oxidoreductase [Thermoanaerobaculia bacterium]|nr:molybdopterin-dependent oxidoreductase [Thermoanaerobaculia bacterium]